MKEFKNALSNKVILNNKGMIEKKYLSDQFKITFENQEIKVLNKLNIKFEFNNEKITMEYFENEKYDDSNIGDEEIIEIANCVKDFHKLSTDNIELSKFEKTYNDFLSEDEDVTENYPVDGNEWQLAQDAFKILKEGNQVLLHNDLVCGNLLKLKNGKFMLIDFEYSGLGNEIFDIASFLAERTLPDNQKNLFIKQFNNVNLDDLKIVCKFLQIFWARWALYKFYLTKKDIYKEIADWKFSEYLKIKIA